MSFSSKSRSTLAAVLLCAFHSLAFATDPLADIKAKTSASNSETGVSVKQNEPTDKQLQALINDFAAALQQQVSQGTPFLLNERLSRAKRVSQLPIASNPALTEKYRRVLEAYRIELDYAKTIETYHDILRDNGDERLVAFLRIGRLALYYQTLDGREAGVWDQSRRQWLRLSTEDSHAISLGIRIAQKHQPPQMMVLPLFGADKKNWVDRPAFDYRAGLSKDVTGPEVQSDSIDKEGILAEVNGFAANLKSADSWPIPGVTNTEDERLLEKFAGQVHTPSIDELIQLFVLSDKILQAQSRISRFTAPVYEPDGHASEREVLRIANFSLISAGRYLTFTPESGRLEELTRQPSANLMTMAEEFSSRDGASLSRVAIDPSAGQMLQLLVQIPNLPERIAQGGVVGYLILLLASAAYLVSAYRFVHLLSTGRRIRRQMHSQDYSPDNPLGRVLLRIQQAPLNHPEALSLVAEDALSEEQTRLDYALSFLKLIAAIAPMLGLLGTVTGMIETFQSIALHGSGDPKLMSGGISEALVTTVEGLVAAIPILLLHSLLSSQSQSYGTLLESHASAALADRLEEQSLLEPVQLKTA